MKLTKVMKEKYVEKYGTECPYCSSKKTLDSEATDEGGYCSRSSSCYDCHKKWTEIYTLTDIEEV